MTASPSLTRERNLNSRILPCSPAASQPKHARRILVYLKLPRLFISIDRSTKYRDFTDCLIYITQTVSVRAHKTEAATPISQKLRSRLPGAMLSPLRSSR